MKKLLSLLALGLVAATGVMAKTWPAKPVTLVVPVNSPHEQMWLCHFAHIPAGGGRQGRPGGAHPSLADVIAHQKANPDKTIFASPGNGFSDHLTAELFWLESGSTGLHIPYKGGSSASSDVLGGQVNASFQNVNAVLQHIKSGKLRPLAVTGARRSSMLPELPTMAEAGVKNVDVCSWQAVVAPKGLASEVHARFRAAVVAALNDAQIKPQLEAVGLEVVANTPEQFAAFRQQEFARWKKVIEVRKITAD